MLTRNTQNLEWLRKDPRVRGAPGFFTVPLDMANPIQIEKKFKTAMGYLNGRVDHLILCHGTITHMQLRDTNLKDWDYRKLLPRLTR